MKALTESQQEIINNLLKEFHGMNETNPIPFTLFNSNTILNELKEKEIEMNEIKLHNNAMSDELIGRLNSYIDILNNDFDNANLLIRAKLSGDTIVIEANKQIVLGVDHTYNVSIYSIRKYTLTKNGFGKTTAYLYANETNSDDRYDTIEQLLETTKFKQRIKRLIEETIRRKK